jgi:hypothetical protein
MGFDNSGFDNPSPASVVRDIDAPAFREQSVVRVEDILQDKLIDLRGIMRQRDVVRLQSFVMDSADDINRAVVGANAQENIYSTSDTAIVHAFGIPIWKKPNDVSRLEHENLAAMTSRLMEGHMDAGRFGEGVYLQEVLLHKYKNSNGRIARGMKQVIDKSSSESQITEDDTKQVLGLGRESLTKTGEHSYKINFNPDFERLVLGVAHFALEKGLTQEQVIDELKLNGALPEDGLQALTQIF